MSVQTFESKLQVKKLTELAAEEELISFKDRLETSGLSPLLSTGITTLQINVGRVCNQSCKHCHVNAGPRRKESMGREIFEQCLAVLDNSDISIVDITGGAPEMNPHFRWFVEEVSRRGQHIIDRCNLTILIEPEYDYLTDFLAEHKVEIVASLPALTKSQTDAQRGEAVFERSIEAMKRLNSVGFGVEGSGLDLNLVTNPVGAFLPGSQASTEARWKRELKKKHGVTFDNLFSMTNMPIGRFLTFLQQRGILKSYMQKLINSYNPHAADNVMCRYMISVDYQGYMYDCDFNQMLGLTVNSGLPIHIKDFVQDKYQHRPIVNMIHCFGCTAGCGSSCGGEVAV